MNKKVLIDTNLVLRLLLNDIPSQSRQAIKIFKQAENGTITIVFSVMVVNELVWILEKFYNLNRRKFVPELKQLLMLKGVVVHEMKLSQLIEILSIFEHSKLDWVDLYLISIAGANNYKLETFDKQLMKLVIS